MRWILSMCLACSVMACGPGAPEGSGLPQVGEPQPDDLTCRRDQDCALVEDCCGCHAGGNRVAVRADRVQDVQARTAAECEARACGTTPSENRTCSASAAVCRGGRCIPAL